MTHDENRAAISASRGVKFFYGFATLWLTVASVVPFIVLAANVKGALFFLWPLAAIGIVIGGTRRTMGLGITIDEASRSVKVDSWFRTVRVPFDAIKEMGRSRVIVGAPRYGGPVYRPAIVRRDEGKIRIGAASGEATDGPIHAALTRLGTQLGVPVRF